MSVEAAQAAIARGDVPSCPAPFSSMEFEPSGNVHACCANTLYPLGRVPDSSLREIWFGERATQLRAAVGDGDWSLGCTICSHRIRHDGTEVPLLGYAHLDPGVVWPERLSFALHNTCNLACVMCGADRSSRIRTQRALLDPLPHVYGDEFFEQLDEFLLRATLIDFVGGEPFLIREHWRVWDRLTELGADVRCAVTTNGTVWNERVEAALAAHPTDVRVSLDALTPELFEAIRVGSDFGEVMRNFDRFRRYCTERGTSLSVSFTLSHLNWFQLADVLLWAEHLDLTVGVQAVMEPGYGIQHLDDADLRRMQARLRDQDAAVGRTIQRNRHIWERQLAMVDTLLADRSAGHRPEPCFDAPMPGNSLATEADVMEWTSDHVAPDGCLPTPAAEYLHRWGLGDTASQRVLVDAAGRVVASEGSVLPPSAAAATSIEALLDRWCVALGGDLWRIERLDRGDHLILTLGVSGPHRDGSGSLLRLIVTATADGGRAIDVFHDDQTRRKPVPVRLSARAGADA